MDHGLVLGHRLVPCSHAGPPLRVSRNRACTSRNHSASCACSACIPVHARGGASAARGLGSRMLRHVPPLRASQETVSRGPGQEARQAGGVVAADHGELSGQEGARP